MVATELKIERDVVFAKGGEIDLTCDVYYPPADVDKRTAVIHLYGGGFRVGSKEAVQTHASLYAERGFLGVAPRYRLVNDALWPAQLEDVKACIRWVRANASRLGIDATKIVVSGHSAGGMLALLAAGMSAGDAQDASVAACVSYYAASVINWHPDGAIDPVMPPGSTDADFKQADPISYMKAGCPPILLMHGTGDKLVSHSHAMSLFDALQDAGAPVELYLAQGMDHAFDSNLDFATLCADVASLFIDRHVSNPRTYPEFGAGRRPSPQA